MKVNTQLFGDIDYPEDEVIFFPNGLPSFENEHHFLLIPIEGSNDSIFCLQSTITEGLSFIAMDPFALNPKYSPELSKDDLQLLHTDSEQKLCFYVLCAMRRPVNETTVNMKCPIVINPKDNLAFQIILDNEDLNMYHALSEFDKQKGELNC